MKGTGIVRHVDDLGRIVIHRAIRKDLEIKDGDLLEFFVDSEKGEILLKKYDAFKKHGIEVAE